MKIIAFVLALRGPEAVHPGMRLSHPLWEIVIGKEKINMRRVDMLIIHCSATKAGMDVGATDIDRWHREQGMAGIGYHYVVRLDGSIEEGRSVAVPGAHCRGWNRRSIGICYIGGLDEAGKPVDTRTEQQKVALKWLVEELRRKYRIERVMGHRDTSPDLNGNGVIEPDEFVKACPCFDVKAWLLTFLMVVVVLVLLAACGSHRVETMKRVEVDSVAVADRELRTERRAWQEQNAREQVNEHIEQTVWRLGKDTAIVTKRVTDRRTDSKRQVQSERSAVCADGSRTVYQSLVKAEQRVEKKRASGSGMGKWLIGGGLLVGILFLCRKLFALDNQWLCYKVNKKMKK